MRYDLTGKRVAILVTDGFEQIELTSPRAALHAAGAETLIVSPQRERVQGWNHDDRGDLFAVDVPVEQARATDFDALLIPGGVRSPDRLRQNRAAVDFVRHFFEQHKPVAAICHGVWLLAEAGVTRGKRMTSYASLRTDLINAGAEWVDEPVVVQNGLVTSRGIQDLEPFNEKVVEEVGEGKHAALYI